MHKMKHTKPFKHPYDTDTAFPLRCAYICMEFGIEQPLKTYAGGLGFLAGSFMRSAYELRLPVIGIGILWKYGYYDQCRKQDQTMDVHFGEKSYGFLEDTGIRFKIKVSRQDVLVGAWYLPPDVFGTAPVFFLSTDLPENDHLARTISHKLYDSNPETFIAASILLGQGSAMLMEALDWQPDLWHMNESHGLPLAFQLYARFRDADEVRRRIVFTSHTPETAGNPKSSMSLLEKMGFFGELSADDVKRLTGTEGHTLDHSLAALRLSGICNGVSKMHGDTLKKMWSHEKNIAPLTYVTNAQSFDYWKDPGLYAAMEQQDDPRIQSIKRSHKRALFEVVADQCGRIFDERTCTIVFAKRFAGYKRPDLFFHHMERFEKLVGNSTHPVQIIWAGKPYPQDYNAIGVFDRIVEVCKRHNNCAILTGYELHLSKMLKRGADLWLNVPRLTHEASGTSGMSAAMNGAVNLALPDGWYPEFARHGVNGFVIRHCDISLQEDLQDDNDSVCLFDALENEVLPMYYQSPGKWTSIIKQAMRDIVPAFDADRMAIEYYKRLYAHVADPLRKKTEVK